MIFPFQVPSNLKEPFLLAFRQRFPEHAGTLEVVKVSDQSVDIVARMPTEFKDEVISFFHGFCGSLGRTYKIIDGYQVTEVNPAAVKPKGDFEAI